MMIRIALISLFLFVSGCTGTPPNGQAAGELLVSADWLASHLDEPGVVVLHVGRDSAEYVQGHIPGARYIPLAAVATNRDGQLNVLPPVAALERAFEGAGVSDDSHVILYGELGGLAAARAFFALDVLGHERLSLLDGGLDAWARSGGALSTEAVSPHPGSLTPRPNERLIVDAHAVNDLRTDPQTLLVDARPPAQHTGEDPGADIQRPGHIPASVNLFWADDLAADGTLRPVEVLGQRYGNAGVSPERDLIAYCRTGMQSSFAYFVMRHLGLHPRMYDGSFHDWSNNTTYPVQTGL